MTTATSSTLPLFWHLSSTKKPERIEASSNLIFALQQFQTDFSADSGLEQDWEENDETEFDAHNARLDSSNAADVAYAVRRLIRGLASSRESSRLGFAVALTELLARIDTVTCYQVLSILKNSSQTSGSMSGQEERDVLFARLFGLMSIIESGLIVREQPLRTSSTSPSTIGSFEAVVSELLTLSEKKSWLRESSWCTLLSALTTLSASQVSWKDEAMDRFLDKVFSKDKSWSPEKVAVTVRLQALQPNKNWADFLGPQFKSGDILSTTNLQNLCRILKESDEEGETENDVPKLSHSGPWKAQLHFVWDIILDSLLPSDGEATAPSGGNLQDFYRIVVDETLFASSSTPGRKFWGFQIFQKIIHRLKPMQMHALFTPNFMRTWINHLSKSDRYLHKAAQKVAVHIQEAVEKDPTTGFTLVLQLLGNNGSQNFDRLTKTKTVESILTKMDADGMSSYLDYLIAEFHEKDKKDAFDSLEARRKWVIEQLSVLLKRATVSKNADCVQKVLTWLTTNAFFEVIKKSQKDANIALQTVPDPPLSAESHDLCKSKLLCCVGELSGSMIEKDEEGRITAHVGTTINGELWATNVVKLIVELEKDAKHVKTLDDDDDEERSKVKGEIIKTIRQLEKIEGDRATPAKGASLLIAGLALDLLAGSGEEDTESGALQDAMKAARDEFVKKDSPKKKPKHNDNDNEEQPPVDILVDVIIGLLENSNNFKRVIANQAFTFLSGLMTDSTVKLILAQLQRRDPGEENEEDEDLEQETDDKSDEDDEDVPEEQPKDVEIEEDEDEDESDDENEFSEEESMDDEQMMQIDEQLAEVFRTKAEEKKKSNKGGAQREATYFKNRVLDLVDIYLKKQPTSPLTLQFVIPLVELVAQSSSDERQLSDKTKGLIRSRFSKPKDTPKVSDTNECIEILEKLHEKARNANSTEALSIINISSLYVFKVINGINENKGQDIYEKSITDFASRKTSAINPNFLLEFIRRFPNSAWNIRMSFLNNAKTAVNGYRQSQLFACIQLLTTNLPDTENKYKDICRFMKHIATTLLEILEAACVTEKPVLSAAQCKEVLKVALHCCRFTRRVTANPSVLASIWKAADWTKLQDSLSKSEHYKNSTSLQSLCKQIFQMGKSLINQKPNGGTLKRKQDAAEDEEGQKVVKARRKKVRKTKTTEKN